MTRAAKTDDTSTEGLHASDAMVIGDTGEVIIVVGWGNDGRFEVVYGTGCGSLVRNRLVQRSLSTTGLRSPRPGRSV